MPLMSGGDAVVRSILGHGVIDDLLPARRAERSSVQRHVRCRRCAHGRCIRGTSRAPPIWRSVPRSRPGKPAVYSVVPGPGFLNSTAALATALFDRRAACWR